MNKFPNYNRGGIWRMFTIQHIPTAWKSTAYLVVNGQTPTEVKKYMHNIARSPYCQLCGSIDTIRHRLSSCRNVREVWTWVCKQMQTVAPTNNPNTVTTALLHLEINRLHNHFLQSVLSMGYMYAIIHEGCNDVTQLQRLFRTHFEKIQRHLSEKSKRIIQKLDM